MKAVFEDWCFNESEVQFIEYFDRLLETEMHFSEIEERLPEINDGYKEAMNVNTGLPVEPDLRDLFRNWRAHRADHNPHRSEKQ